MIKMNYIIAVTAAIALGASAHAGTPVVVTESAPVEYSGARNAFAVDLGVGFQHSKDASDTVAALELGAGWAFDTGGVYSHFLGVNLIYTDDFKEHIDGDFFDATVEFNIFGIYGLYRPYIRIANTGLKIYGEAGLGAAYVDVDVTVRSVFGSFSDSDDDWSFSVRGGAGLEYDFTETVALRVGYSYIYIDSASFFGGDHEHDDFHGGTLALVLRF